MSFLSLKSMSSIKKMSLSKQIMEMSSFVKWPSLGYFLILFSPYMYIVCSIYVHVFPLPLKFNFYEDRICIFFNFAPPPKLVYIANHI